VAEQFLKKLIAHFREPLEAKHRKQFIAELLIEDIQRLRWISLAMIIWASIWSFVDISTAHNTPLDNSITNLIILDVMMLFTGIIFFFLFIIYSKETAQPRLAILRILRNAFSLVVLCITAGIASVESNYTPGYPTYIMACFGTASLVHLSNRMLLSGFLLSLVLLFSSSVVESGSFDSFLQNFVSIVTLLPLAWYVSNVLRSTRIKQFKFRILAQKANKELHNYSKQLDSRVKKRTAELQHANKTLIEEIQSRRVAEEEKETMRAMFLKAQRMEALGTLAGGVAHDFNNLLTAITGYTILAKRGVSTPDAVLQNLTYVEEASSRATALTRQLLLFSRSQPMETTFIDVNETIDSMLKLIARLIGENISIETNLSKALNPIIGDRANIEQIIMNLAVNARDAMEQGGSLIFKTENVCTDNTPCTDASKRNECSTIKLTVADTGTGMDEKTKEKIFEPFFTTKPAGKGTGLGMAVVYGVVSQHKGRIEVDSTPGVGTTFSIYLPCCTDDEKIPQAPSITRDLAIEQGNGEFIMLVEDEEKVRDLMTELLQRAGYRVVAAASVEEAISIYKEKKDEIQLLLSDIRLPDGNGLDIEKTIHQLMPHLPAILMSGYPDDTSAEEIKRRQIPYLAKPFSPFSMLEIVREELKSKTPSPAS